MLLTLQIILLFIFKRASLASFTTTNPLELLLSQKRGLWGYFEYEQTNNLQAAIFAMFYQQTTRGGLIKTMIEMQQNQNHTKQHTKRPHGKVANTIELI